MGKKVNPIGFRLSIRSTWNSKWYANDKLYKTFVLEDFRLRTELFKKLKFAGLAKVEIGRSINKVDVILYVAKPGVVIGRGGSGLEDLKKFITQFLTKGKKNTLKIELKIEPIKETNLNAHLVASNISDQLIRRIPHRRAVTQSLERVMSAGAKGVRIALSGRINGAEISRVEKYQDGSMPLSTLREDIDYASVPALTKSGYVGVKVWICRKS